MQGSAFGAISRPRPDFSRQRRRQHSYLHGLTRTAGHADRIVPMGSYTKGLLLAGGPPLLFHSARIRMPAASSWRTNLGILFPPLLRKGWSPAGCKSTGSNLLSKARRYSLDTPFTMND